MFDELWQEIQDSSGEIFDIPEDELEEIHRTFAMSEEEFLMTFDDNSN